MQKIIPTLLCFALAACVADNTARLVTINKIESCNHYNSIWVKKAECLDEAVRTDNSGYFEDQGSQEIIAYRQLLIEKVHSGRMTNSEANYAFQKRIGEMNKHLAQQRVYTSVEPIIVPVPQQPQMNRVSSKNTTCTKDGNSITCHNMGINPLDTSALDPRK